MAECLTRPKNMGVSQCNKLPAMPSSMIKTPAGFKATPEEVVDPAFWQAALKAGIAERVFLFPNFVDLEDKSEQTVYKETALAFLKVRPGKYRWLFFISENLCIHKALHSHFAKQGRAFLFDNENQLFGTFDSDGNVRGFTIQLFNAEKLKLSNGTDPTLSPVLLALQNPDEIDENGALVDADFVTELVRLTDVTLEIISAAAALIVVKVSVTCDGTPVNGLALADFVLTETDGDPQVISARTEADGTYSLTKASGAWVDGFLDLAAPSALTIDAYESTGKVVVNIP